MGTWLSRWTRGSAVSGLVIFIVGGASAQGSPRTSEILSEGWKFTRGDVPSGFPLSYDSLKAWILPTGNAHRTGTPYVRPSAAPQTPTFASDAFDDASWKTVQVPHDYAIEGPFNPKGEPFTGRLPYQGVSWYRRKLQFTADDRTKKLLLNFDGAMSHATVWLNGKLVGGWPFGYASWQVDLTPYAKFGATNQLAVRLENPPESSRWYPGAGIYRKVWLDKVAPVHFKQWGVKVTTSEVTEQRARIRFTAQVINEGTENSQLKVTTRVFAWDPKRQKVGQQVGQFANGVAGLGPNGETSLDGDGYLIKPKLWSPAHPSLYAAITTIASGGKVVDEVTTRFGIRSMVCDPQKGLLVNGEKVRINGVCNHHDLGAIGTAVNRRALQRQLEILKDMGGNAIRTSHNPPAPELLDLCDEMGFVVLDEAFDVWYDAKMENDYHLHFKDWHEADLRALIRRDFNHPSVFAWSVGNEIPEQRGATANSSIIAKELVTIAHQEDPTRPATSACDNWNSGFNAFHSSLDLMGFNYKPWVYDRFVKATPNQFVFGSETASTLSSRGEYFFPVPAGKGTIINVQQLGGGVFGKSKTDSAESIAAHHVSSYDLSYPAWASSPDMEFEGQDRTPSVAGEFVWTGFDYIGETTPYERIEDPSRSSFFGILDLAGFKKDRFYIYQARWRSDFPMAHILPHWNWPDRLGKVTPVHVYTSGDEAELFLNGKSLGRKKKGAFEYRLRWDEVVYQPGELKVIAYKNGVEWAEEKVSTTGAAAKLVADADRTVVQADGFDLCYFTVRVADAKGQTVPTAKLPVHAEVTGAGEIIATDNGDPNDQTAFPSHDRKTFNGLLLVIVKAKSGQGGRIQLNVSSEGLRSASTRVTARPAK